MKDSKEIAPAENELSVRPTCPKCGSHRFTFSVAHGPCECAQEIEELLFHLKKQADERERECEKWYAQQLLALEQTHQARLSELQPETEESAFQLLNDDEASHEKLEQIELEHRKSQQVLNQKLEALKEKIAEEREKAIQSRIGPENVVKLVFCEECGHIIGVAEPTLNLTSLQAAIEAMHQDLLQCLKMVAARLTQGTKAKNPSG